MKFSQQNKITNGNNRKTKFIKKSKKYISGYTVKTSGKQWLYHYIIPAKTRDVKPLSAQHMQYTNIMIS